MMRRTTLAATLCGLLAVGCASGSAAPLGDSAADAKERAPMATDLQSMIQAALADAARRAPPGAPAPTLARAQKVTWPDGSLGCPTPDRMYTMALVPGYRIRVQSGAALLDYHAGERGPPFLCPPDRATEPVSGNNLTD